VNENEKTKMIKKRKSIMRESFQQKEKNELILLSERKGIYHTN
jgi:hypothetical protein